jgi:tetratricopeptide (TPR) repeat protein
MEHEMPCTDSKPINVSHLFSKNYQINCDLVSLRPIMNKFLVVFLLLFSSCTSSTSKLFDHAIDLMTRNQFEEASTTFSNIIKKDTTFEAARLYRGLCLFQLKKYQLALDDFNYLIQQHPQESLLKNPVSQRVYGNRNHTRLEFFDPYFQRAVTRYFMDSLIFAKTDFEFVLKQSNRVSICRNYLANIYYLQGDLSNACNQIKLIENSKTSEKDLEIEKLKKLYCQ